MLSNIILEYIIFGLNSTQIYNYSKQQFINIHFAILLIALIGQYHTQLFFNTLLYEFLVFLLILCFFL